MYIIISTVCDGGYSYKSNNKNLRFRYNLLNILSKLYTRQVFICLRKYEKLIWADCFSQRYLTLNIYWVLTHQLGQYCARLCDASIWRLRSKIKATHIIICFNNDLITDFGWEGRETRCSAIVGKFRGKSLSELWALGLSLLLIAHSHLPDSVHDIRLLQSMHFINGIISSWVSKRFIHLFCHWTGSSNLSCELFLLWK